MKHLITLILLALCSIVTAAAQSIPTYTTVVTTPADGATVSSVTAISVSLSRDGFDAPIGIMPGSQPVTATKTVGTTQTAIDGITTAVRGEQLVVTFAQPVAEPCMVSVSIPAGVTNNLAMPVANMTTDEIIAEGGCTNPAIALTLNVVPSVVPVKDVTGIGHDAQYLTDSEGNFIKDEKGQYIRQDQYDSLVDAQLTPSSDTNPDGDRVTVLYFWYDTQFASINYTGGASVTNITTGRPMSVATVSFKTGGDSHRNDVIELRLSTESYIQSEEHHQGVYEVVLPEGIATTADGLKSGGCKFRFTFGDPEKAYVPEEVNLDAYLGDYEALAEEGEESTGESFTFVKDNGTYYVADLDGSQLRIPVESVGEKFYLKYTDASEGAFMSLRGGDVEMLFQEFEGNRYIYVDQYALYPADGEPIIGGVINFLLTKAAEPAERTETESGVATGIFYAFYTGERDIDYIPVPFTKYDDGSVCLSGFANGKDLFFKMGEEDEYGCLSPIIDDMEDVGANEEFSYEGFEEYVFDIYRFVEPVTIGPDKIAYLFLDGTTYYDPTNDTLVLDYVSDIDDEEYMFLIDFSLTYKPEVPDGVALLPAASAAAGAIYDLQGRRTNGNARGVTISRGKVRIR